MAWKTGRREYQRLEQPAAGWFWYRASQTTLRPREYLNVFSPHGVFNNHLASWDDPAITGADSLVLVRTPGGKLDTFRINLGDRLLPMWKSAENPSRSGATRCLVTRGYADLILSRGLPIAIVWVFNRPVGSVPLATIRASSGLGRILTTLIGNWRCEWGFYVAARVFSRGVSVARGTDRTGRSARSVVCNGSGGVPRVGAAQYAPT